MNCNTIAKPCWDFLYLVACALNEQPPEADKLRSMDLASVYRVAKAHSMAAITAMAIESCGDFRCTDPELSRKWKESKEKAIRKNLLLDAERAQILSYLESERIWYMPLKGSVLKDLYPKYGMREMADNDILFDPAGREKLHAFMTGRGYDGTYNKGDSHDTYYKPPIYNFELHPTLFGRAHDPVWRAYYADVKDLLEADCGKAYGFRFRDEDFYLYTTVHAYKHYRRAGTGLRALADAYAFLRSKESKLDWDYLYQEAEKLGIADFEKQLRLLAQKLFHSPGCVYEVDLTEEEDTLLCSLIGMGTYGTFNNLISSQIEQLGPGEGGITWKAKLHYLFARMFPNMEYYESFHPFVARHRILIPFFCIFRFFRGIVRRRKQIPRELRAVRAAGRDKSESK